MRVARLIPYLGCSVFLLTAPGSPTATYGQTGVSPALDVVLARATSWTRSFQQDLSGVVAEERYEQREGLGAGPVRSTRAELILLRLSDGSGWVHFRDVFEVNGRPVRDRRDRIQRLFLDAPDRALRDARRLTEESSRYNLGAVLRTINVPTFALSPLDPRWQARFTFALQREEEIDGLRAWHVRFVERSDRGRTLVRTVAGGDVAIEGALWVESAPGRVVRTLVKTLGTQDPDRRPPPHDGHTLMWVQTTYGTADESGLWVPVSMREWSRATNMSEVFGTATYSNFRRFAVTSDTTFDVGRR